MAISNAEWDIMRVVWTKGQATSGDILTVLGAKNDWSASTVKTLLKRLVDKGYLATSKIGKGFIYSALLAESDAMAEQVDEVFSKFCRTKHVAILEHLLADRPMTEADISALQLLLEKKKASAVDKVVCDCVLGQCKCKEHLN